MCTCVGGVCLCSRECALVCPLKPEGSYVEASSLLSSGGFWEPNLHYQAQWQVPLLPSHLTGLTVNVLMSFPLYSFDQC